MNPRRLHSVFDTTWVHVFEKDTPRGDMYWPLEADIPLSRRPRERFQLFADGSARVWRAGADDRPQELDASWSEEGGAIVIRSSKADPVLRIVEQAADHLIVKT